MKHTLSLLSLTLSSIDNLGAAFKALLKEVSKIEKQALTELDEEEDEEGGGGEFDDSGTPVTVRRRKESITDAIAKLYSSTAAHLSGQKKLKPTPAISPLPLRLDEEESVGTPIKRAPSPFPDLEEAKEHAGKDQEEEELWRCFTLLFQALERLVANLLSYAQQRISASVFTKFLCGLGETHQSASLIHFDDENKSIREMSERCEELLRSFQSHQKVRIISRNFIIF